MKSVQLDLDGAAGVTSFGGHHYRADQRGEVTIPDQTADALIASKAVRPSRRLFGGIPSLPSKAEFEAHGGR